MKKLALLVEGNLGYGADQIQSEVTLEDLAQQIADAIDEHGADTVVVVKATNNRYGAEWGRLDAHAGLFEERDEDDESEGEGDDW